MLPHSKPSLPYVPLPRALGMVRQRIPDLDVRISESTILLAAGGSDASAAGGGESELSEWQRSTDAKALCRRRQMSGTATGMPLLEATDNV